MALVPAAGRLWSGGFVYLVEAVAEKGVVAVRPVPQTLFAEDSVRVVGAESLH